MRFIVLCVFFLLSSCIKPIEYDTIDYNRNELEKIKENYFLLREIFNDVEKKSKIHKSYIGYSFSGNKLYFGNCISKNGIDLLDSHSCNYSKYLSVEQRRYLSSAINELKNLKIDGFIYLGPLQDYALNIERNYSSFENQRYLYIKRAKKVVINEYIYVIMDKKESVFYLKNKM